MTQPANSAPRVAVVGGGLAGLAAGCALAGSGARVTLFERRPFLGGRASSYEHPATGEVVDNCQHVLLGCCTNLLAFYRRIGVDNKIRWYDRLNFVEPGGRRTTISPSLLPAPLHTLPSFLRGSALSLFDKLAIGRAMLAIARLPNPAPDDPQVSFLDWLHQHGQTRGAIERFWKVVLVSALNEDLDRISVRYAVQVFRESFLNSAVAGRMGVPTVPLTQLYSAAGDYIRERGGEVVLRSSVAAVTPQGEYVALGIDGNTNFARFDYVVLAVASTVIEKLLPDDDVAQGLREQVVHLDTSPITGIHLWFDRDITDLDHAVLLDRTIQWLFYKSRFQPQRAESQGSYLELVVSSSKSLVDKTRQQILDLALSELREFFPAANQAQLLKATVIKELHATFSVKPGVDRYRPATQTGWPRVFLAGDWTQTGWPATMEGAVRSGYLAAEALTRAAASGDPQTFVAPDLAAAGLMRFR